MMNLASGAGRQQPNVGFLRSKPRRFLSKGRGRSLMLSDFLVSHPENPFFQLSQSEWAAATTKYSELLEENNIEYIDRSTSASIQVGNGAYFDNDAVLSQFTRLFKMLPFKQAYKNKVIIIIVDNARIHSAKEFSLEDFGIKPGTRCPIDQILYKDEMGRHQKLDCYFTSGRHKGKSKGLLILAEELTIQVPPKTSLDHLKQLLSSHNAFQNVRLFFYLLLLHFWLQSSKTFQKSKLETLAKQYRVKIIFSPKFHCELYCIEGLWAHQKQLVRKRTDQTFPTMSTLIKDSRNNFIEKNVAMKLFRRFWRTLEAYDRGDLYEEALKLYFSSLCKNGVYHHRRITNSNLQDSGQ
ncbi:unnamed protein product [Rotaria magnacalcarata]|uniref:Uncharacterized protein n=1 Tax=Rotaria magnacalcarata TaxID=392030 RepID=A0A816ZYR1_9BILA|nr:unnamed protein product [Rotaria magnacalcarata]CAF4272682.1 unnamed protein product [Rotaria magnacalcarata]